MENAHSILPFSGLNFFLLMAGSVFTIWIAKLIFGKSKQAVYEIVLWLINTLYIVFLYPKPVQFLSFIIGSYLFFHFVGRKLRLNNILVPMLLLSVPLIFMKITNILDDNFRFYSLLKNVFQITGLSFATFRIIQLYVDEKNSDTKISIVQYMNFTMFLPTLLIGPLDRFNRFSMDVKDGFLNVNMESFTGGLDLLLKGVVFKFIIAELINRLILMHLINDGSLFYHLSTMYSYLFYLFFDFAGYSLLAMSFGKMLGINVPYNFNKPFSVVNIKEFWQHWHKTLGDWLNDYFFKPMFKRLTEKGVFKPIIRQNIALFSTFVLMGFWNGFEFHFILSGCLFGLYAIIHNYYVYRCKKQKRDVLFGAMNQSLVKFFSILITFNAIAFAIYIFSGKLI